MKTVSRYLIFVFYLFSIHDLLAQENLNRVSKDPRYYYELANTVENSDVEKAKLSLVRAFNLLKKFPDNALEIQVLLKQASIAKTEKSFLIGLSFLGKAELLAKNFSSDFIFDIHLVRAEIKFIQKKYDAAILSLNSAIFIAEQLEKTDPVLLFRILNMKGQAYGKSGKSHLAITAYLLAQHHVHSQSDKTKVKLWNNIAFIYSKLNENYSAIKYFSRAYTILKKESTLSQKTKVLLDISRSYKKVSLYGESLKFGHKALKVAQSTKNEEFTLKALLHISIIYRRLNSYDNALKYGLDALSIYTKNNDFNGMSSSSNAIGLIYARLGKKTKAKQYFQNVINFPKGKIKTKYHAAALRELALYHYQDQDYTSALALSKQAIQLYKNINDLKGVATINKNMGLIYQDMGEADLSIKAFKYAVEISKKTGEAWEEAINLAYIANAYADKDLESTQYWAKESLQISEKINATSIKKIVYSALILSFENMNKYQQALIYAKLQNKVINELKTDALNKRVAEMSVLQDVVNKTYELDVLKKNMLDLSEIIEQQKVQLAKISNEVENKKRLNQKLWGTIVVLLISFLLGFVMFLLKLKKVTKENEGE